MLDVSRCPLVVSCPAGLLRGAIFHSVRGGSLCGFFFPLLLFVFSPATAPSVANNNDNLPTPLVSNKEAAANGRLVQRGKQKAHRVPLLICACLLWAIFDGQGGAKWREIKVAIFHCFARRWSSDNRNFFAADGACLLFNFILLFCFVLFSFLLFCFPPLASQFDSQFASQLSSQLFSALSCAQFAASSQLGACLRAAPAQLSSSWLHLGPAQSAFISHLATRYSRLLARPQLQSRLALVCEFKVANKNKMPVLFAALGCSALISWALSCGPRAERELSDSRAVLREICTTCSFLCLGKQKERSPPFVYHHFLLANAPNWSRLA